MHVRDARFTRRALMIGGKIESPFGRTEDSDNMRTI